MNGLLVQLLGYGILVNTSGGGVDRGSRGGHELGFICRVDRM